MLRDLVKQIKHTFLAIDMHDEGRNKISRSPKEQEMKEYFRVPKKFPLQKKIKQSLKVYLKASLWQYFYSEILL